MIDVINKFKLAIGMAEKANEFIDRQVRFIKTMFPKSDIGIIS